VDGGNVVKRILVAFAGKHGSTAQVAAKVAQRISTAGHHVELVTAENVPDVSGYDGVVVGGSLYMGRWNADARHLLKHNHLALQEIPLAVFALGPKTLSERDVADSRAQLDAALAKTPELFPALIAIFGGVVEPGKLAFPLNRLPATDARDWHAIDDWADDAARVFATSAGAPVNA
jgi:menaquinone-dependent protoporphyrinogen oxidase